MDVNEPKTHTADKMNSVHQVQKLFNQKAQSWSKKYDCGGALQKRIDHFQAVLFKTIPPPATVLDLGCGTGNLAIYLAQQGYRVTACDIAEQMLEVARQMDSTQLVQWSLLTPDWGGLPFANEHFAAIVSSSTFEYLDHVDSVLAECARALKTQGTLAITVPNPLCRTRIREERLRRLIKFPVFRCWEVIPKFRQYFSYLRVSQNRFSKEHWRELGRGCGLFLEDELSSEVPAPGGEPTLLLLCFVKQNPIR